MTREQLVELFNALLTDDKIVEITRCEAKYLEVLAARPPQWADLPNFDDLGEAHVYFLNHAELYKGMRTWMSNMNQAQYELSEKYNKLIPKSGDQRVNQITPQGIPMRALIVTCMLPEL